jgi:uncharacterized protein (DUF2336 family)
MTPAAQSLLAQLDSTLAEAPTTWRSAALRQIVELFVAGAESFSDDHVDVFDEVLSLLIKKSVDRTQLAEISNRLAPVDNAPAKVVDTLARHSDVAVHGPVLAQAKALADEVIVDLIDRDRVDPKLLARIAGRAELSTAVTDVLLKRGNAAIQRKIIDNPNAHISEAGFARVVSSVNGNKQLAAPIAARKDLPEELRIWLDKTLNK